MQNEDHALREALLLIDEINERSTSCKFYGISQTLHAKLATIRATLARAALSTTPTPAPIDAETLAAIGEMMGKHVDNWPNPKQLKTAIALIDKTLRAALETPAPIDNEALVGCGQPAVSEQNPNPSSALVEEVARAIARAEGEDWHSWEDHYLAAARAVLALPSIATVEQSSKVQSALLEEAIGALEDVVNPLGRLQREAEATGAQLSGMAYSIANDLSFVQQIARDTLAKLKEGRA